MSKDTRIVTQKLVTTNLQFFAKAIAIQTLKGWKHSEGRVFQSPYVMYFTKEVNLDSPLPPLFANNCRPDDPMNLIEAPENTLETFTAEVNTEGGEEGESSSEEILGATTATVSNSEESGDSEEDDALFESTEESYAVNEEFKAAKAFKRPYTEEEVTPAAMKWKDLQKIARALGVLDGSTRPTIQKAVVEKSKEKWGKND